MNWRQLSGDLWGGLASMLVALPSAIAFGVLVFSAIDPSYAGLGATAGALGAGALGLIAPLVSRNGGFITAPAAPAAAVMSGLAGTLAVSEGLEPSRVIALMVVTAVLSAILQVIYGLIGLGRLIKYIPYQVVSGYLSGVAVIIALGQLPKLFGLSGRDWAKHLLRPDLWQVPSLIVGLVTIVVTAGAPRVTKQIPSAILGLAAGVGTYFGLAQRWPSLWKLTDNPLIIGPMQGNADLLNVVLERGRGLLQLQPSDVGLVLATAVTLSVLLSIDTLKTGVVLDALTHSRHNSNRELVGQGVANAVCALTGGMPGAGTMGPTLVNITSGGRSPLSGFLSGAFSLIAFLALGQVLAWVPIGAMAGILLVVAFKMFDWQVFGLLRHRRTRLDFAIIAGVVLVAETVGLIEASATGIGLAILLFIRDQVRSSVLAQQCDISQTSSSTRRRRKARKLLAKHGAEGLIAELQGNLFFGTTDQLMDELKLDGRRFVLLDLRRVQSMDYTAGHLLNQLHARLQDHDGALLLSGMPSSAPSRQDIERYLRNLGLVDDMQGVRVFEYQNSALEWMEEQILEGHGYDRAPSSKVVPFTKLDLFREFDVAALGALQAIAEVRELSAGAAVFQQGDEGDELFLVRSGRVDVYLPLPGGKRHHIATFVRGSYFGEMAFLDKGARSADAEAALDTSLYCLSRARFNDISRADAVVGAKVYARLALVVSERLRESNASLRLREER